MSIQDFTGTLKSKAMRDWFQRLSTDNILKIGAKDIRKQEAGAEFNSFYITESTIADVISKLTGKDKDSITQEEINTVFNKLKTAKYGATKNRGKVIKEPYIEGQGLYFPRVSFTNISTLINSGFSDYINNESKISDYFQQGHVYGIFPKKIAQTRKSLEAGLGGLTPDQKSLLTGIFADLEKSLMEEDLASSNLKTSAFKLYGKYSKNSSRYLVELQLKEINEAAGRAQGDLSKAVRKYFNPGAITVTKDGGVAFTEGAGAQKLKNIILANIEKVYNSKGSPSITDLIQEDIFNALSGKKKKPKSYSLGETEVISSKGSKIDTTAIKKKIAGELAEVRKAKALISRIKTNTRSKEELPTTNLTSLLTLLNTSLFDQIKNNMGTGNETKVLNFRSGRLAESARVERLSQSREGMVSAFYSYMRNPYGTFSEGGKQQYPRTRDPKTLISKSIREIGATMVGNRMRSVLV